VKLLWLAICNIEGKRARERAKEQGATRDAHDEHPAGSSKARSPRTESRGAHYSETGLMKQPKHKEGDQRDHEHHF